MKLLFEDPSSSSTESNITILSPRYAGFNQRLCAGLIDMAAIALLLGIFAAGFSFLAMNWIVPNLAFPIFWLYFAGFESSAKQATPGKIAFRLVVTNVAGQRISFSRASWRCIGKVAVLLTLGIGLVITMFDTQRRGLDDFMAGTRVHDLDAAADATKPSTGSYLIGLALILLILGCFAILERTRRDFENHHVISALLADIHEGLQRPYVLYYQDNKRLPTSGDLHFQNSAVDSVEVDANGVLILHINKPKAVLRLTPQIDKVNGVISWDCKFDSEISHEYPVSCRS